MSVPFPLISFFFLSPRWESWTPPFLSQFFSLFHFSNHSFYPSAFSLPLLLPSATRTKFVGVHVGIHYEKPSDYYFFFPESRVPPFSLFSNRIFAFWQIIKTDAINLQGERKKINFNAVTFFLPLVLRGFNESRGHREILSSRFLKTKNQTQKQYIKKKKKTNKGRNFISLGMFLKKF